MKLQLAIASITYIEAASRAINPYIPRRGPRISDDNRLEDGRQGTMGFNESPLLLHVPRHQFGADPPTPLHIREIVHTSSIQQARHKDVCAYL
jgi:hypothetical protein